MIYKDAGKNFSSPQTLGGVTIETSQTATETVSTSLVCYCREFLKGKVYRQTKKIIRDAKKLSSSNFARK